MWLSGGACGPLTPTSSFCVSDSEQKAGMRNKRRGALKEEGGADGAPGPRTRPCLGLGRTSVMTVLLGVLVALSGARAQSAAQEDVVIVGEAMGGGLLEASRSKSTRLNSSH